MYIVIAFDSYGSTLAKRWRCGYGPCRTPYCTQSMWCSLLGFHFRDQQGTNGVCVCVCVCVAQYFRRLDSAPPDKQNLTHYQTIPFLTPSTTQSADSRVQDKTKRGCREARGSRKPRFWCPRSMEPSWDNTEESSLSRLLFQSRLLQNRPTLKKKFVLKSRTWEMGNKRAKGKVNKQ